MTRHGIAQPPAEGTPPAETIPLASGAEIDAIAFVNPSDPPGGTCPKRSFVTQMASTRSTRGQQRDVADISIKTKSP